MGNDKCQTRKKLRNLHILPGLSGKRQHGMSLCSILAAVFTHKSTGNLITKSMGPGIVESLPPGTGTLRRGFPLNDLHGCQWELESSKAIGPNIENIHPTYKISQYIL